MPLLEGFSSMPVGRCPRGTEDEGMNKKLDQS